jgi:hypothetical protein
MRIFNHCLAMIGISTFATNAAAHHSFAAEFSYELFGSREGEVVEVHFVNPHAHVFFAVKNEDGEEQIWNAQTFPPQTLLRRGWNRDSIKVGDRIIIEGNLGLENSNKLWVVTMPLEDGTIIQPRVEHEAGPFP